MAAKKEAAHRRPAAKEIQGGDLDTYITRLSCR